jgi:transaldolase/glucose-6-phosphate isomerase
MIPIRKIQQHGQSIWLDHTSKGFHSDRLHEWIEAGWIGGLTSSIGLTAGEQAQDLLRSPQLRLLSHAGMQAEEILMDLVIEEYRAAADLLLPIFERSNGDDGFVTIDIDPHTLSSQEEMIKATERVWSLINRPNLLVSIPVNKDSIDVLAAVLDEGVNVNATLIYSLEQYLEVVEVYISSLERRLARGASIEHVVSTASFFIADIDQRTNQGLEKFKGEGTEALRARALVDEIGLAVAKLAYAQFVVSYKSDRFSSVAQAGGRVQRILWTGLENNINKPAWEYVRQLVGHDTITTATFSMLEESEIEDGIGQTLEEGLSEARSKLQALESIGVLNGQGIADLQSLQLESRRQGYTSILESVGQNTRAMSREIEPVFSTYQPILADLGSANVSSRIWKADVSLWTTDKRKSRRISNRFGWLNLPQHVRAITEACRAFSAELQSEQIENLVVICSGSVCDLLKAIAHELKDQEQSLLIVDPDAPDEFARALAEIEVAGTHFVFVTGHVDRDALNNIPRQAWSDLLRQTDMDPAGQATLIAGEAAAETLRKSGWEFKHFFALPEDMPFHFSGLSFPGMITAAWLDLNLDDIHAGVSRAMSDCLPAIPPERNPAFALAGAIAGALRSDHDQIMLVGSSYWHPYLPWMEGLFLDAGIIKPEQMGHARIEEADTISSQKKRPLVVFLRELPTFENVVESFVAKGVPVKILDLEASTFSVGRLVGLTAFSIAALGYLLAADPFTQDE